MQASADYWRFFKKNPFVGICHFPMGNLGIWLLIHQCKIRPYYGPKFHFWGRAGSMKVAPKVYILHRYQKWQGQKCKRKLNVDLNINNSSKYFWGPCVINKCHHCL
jgi:hypothetical protein